MDFSAVALTEAQQAFREEVRAFLDEHLTPEVYAGMRERAASYDEGFYLALGAKGWLWPRWRKEDGGAELDDVCVKILETELADRDAPMSMIGLTQLVWPAVEAHGDPGAARRAEARDSQRDDPDLHRLHRAGRRVRHRRGQDPGGPRRRRVGHQRAEDLHLQRPVRHPRLPAHPDRPDPAQAQGPDPLPGADSAPRDSSASRCPPSADETTNISLLQRHPRSRPVPHRRGQQRLVHAARPAGRRAPPRRPGQ